MTHRLLLASGGDERANQEPTETASGSDTPVSSARARVSERAEHLVRPKPKRYPHAHAGRRQVFAPVAPTTTSNNKTSKQNANEIDTTQREGMGGKNENKNQRSYALLPKL